MKWVVITDRTHFAQISGLSSEFSQRETFSKNTQNIITSFLEYIKLFILKKNP